MDSNLKLMREACWKSSVAGVLGQLLGDAVVKALTLRRFLDVGHDPAEWRGQAGSTSGRCGSPAKQARSAVDVCYRLAAD